MDDVLLLACLLVFISALVLSLAGLALFIDDHRRLP
jgi:hypothetical protein